MSKRKISLNAIIWVVASIFALTTSVLFVLLKGRNFAGNYIMPIFAAFTMPVFLALKRKWIDAAIFGVLGIAFLSLIKYMDSLHPNYSLALAESYSFILLNLIAISIYLVKYLRANVRIVIKGQNDKRMSIFD